MLWPGLVNFVPAVAYHFCLRLPAALTQPGRSFLSEPCTCVMIRPCPLNIWTRACFHFSQPCIRWHFINTTLVGEMTTYHWRTWFDDDQSLSVFYWLLIWGCQNRKTEGVAARGEDLSWLSSGFAMSRTGIGMENLVAGLLIVQGFESWIRCPCPAVVWFEEV